MAKPKADSDTKPGFEGDLEQLEQIVEALEEGGLSLDDSLKRFEEGVTLARRCEKALSEAEKKIEMLVKKADGSLEAVPFDEDAPPEEAPAEKPRAAKPAPVAKPAPAPAPTRDTAPSYEEDELPF
jgi:exodeoxyribonuclease VII small subunit